MKKNIIQTNEIKPNDIIMAEIKDAGNFADSIEIYLILSIRKGIANLNLFEIFTISNTNEEDRAEGRYQPGTITKICSMGNWSNSYKFYKLEF